MNGDRPQTAPSRYRADSNFPTYNITEYEQDLIKKTGRPKTGRPNRSEATQSTSFNELNQPMEIKSLLPSTDYSHQFFCNADNNRILPDKTKAKRPFTANPTPDLEKLNFNRMKLKEFPDLQKHQTTKILEVQNNYIKSISNICHLQNIVFLDLFNNQIESISGIDTLVSMRVLMLGKNMISELDGLKDLKKLDILDLQYNRLTEISNLKITRKY
jgi:Leucine-rich repeat (LRR) protein